MKHVSKNICLHILKSEDYSGFLGNISITLIDKTDGKDPKRRENYWMRALKTYHPFGLNIEDSVGPIPCRSINVTGALIISVFFGILVRPGTDLGQDFSDMAWLYCLFPYYLLVILCNLSLHYMLLLYYMLVLLPLSGTSYCTVYLFIILIYTIV